MDCKTCGSRCKSIRKQASILVSIPITADNFDTFLSSHGLRRWKIQQKLKSCMKIAGEEYIIGYSVRTDKGDFLYSEELTMICDENIVEPKIHLFCHGNSNVFALVKDFLALSHHYFTTSQLSNISLDGNFSAIDVM